MNIAVGALAPVLAVPSPMSARGPDPIFAAIEEHREALATHGEASRAHSKVEEHLNKQRQRHRPHIVVDGRKLFTNEEIDGVAPLGTGCHSNTPTGFIFEWAKSPSAARNAELRAQLKAEFDRCEEQRREALQPYEDASGVACDAEWDAAAKLLDVTPTTMAGLMALLRYVGEVDSSESFGYWPEHMEGDDGDDNLGGLSWHAWMLRHVRETLEQMAGAGRMPRQDVA